MTARCRQGGTPVGVEALIHGSQSAKRHTVDSGDGLSFRRIAGIVTKHQIEEDQMHVLTTAKMLGLEADERGELSGTVEEGVVLAALEELSAAHPDHADLFILAADRVRSSRSAGLEVLEKNSVFGRYRESNEIQLRYRGETAEIFTDLAIDLALRGVPVTEPDESEATITTV